MIFKLILVIIAVIILISARSSDKIAEKILKNGEENKDISEFSQKIKIGCFILSAILLVIALIFGI